MMITIITGKNKCTVHSAVRAVCDYTWKLKYVSYPHLKLKTDELKQFVVEIPFQDLKNQCSLSKINILYWVKTEKCD